MKQIVYIKKALLFSLFIGIGFNLIHAQDSLYIDKMEDSRSITNLSVSTMRKFNPEGQVSVNVDVEMSFFVKEGVENVSAVHVVIKKNGSADTRSITIQKSGSNYYTMYENKQIKSSGKNIRLLFEKNKDDLEDSTIELYVIYHTGGQSNVLDYSVY